MRILRSKGYPEDILQAILGHAHYTNTPRESRMAKTLFAVDELTGLITATALVRPTKSVHEVDAKSVRKKMKDKAFARGVSREDVINGANELGVDLDEHITFVIASMQARARPTWARRLLALHLGGIFGQLRSGAPRASQARAAAYCIPATWSVRVSFRRLTPPR